MQKINNSINCRALRDPSKKYKLAIGNESYKFIPIQSIIFNYGIRSGTISPTVGSPNR